MTAEATLDSVIDALRRTIPGAPAIDARTELLSSGLLDSLGIVLVVSLLEERHGIEFPPRQLVPEVFADAAGIAEVLEAARKGTTP